MHKPELYRRTIVRAFSVPESVALLLYAALVDVARTHNENLVRQYKQGFCKRSPHKLLVTGLYVVLRFHELSDIFGLPLQKIALYRTTRGWTLEVDCRSADPNAEVFHFLDRVGTVTGVRIAHDDLVALPSPSVELVTAIDVEPYLEVERPRDPRIRRYGGKVLESHRLEARLPGFEGHPFAYEAVITHQGKKRNRSPKLARFEFVPIARQGYSPLTFQHARLPAALGNDAWLMFARHIHDLLVNENPDLPYARVPSYWRGVPITVNTQKTAQRGKATEPHEEEQ